MIEELRPFLDKSFETSFTRYQKDWIDLGLQMSERHSELIASDVFRRHPHLASATFAETLAGIIETDSTVQATLLYRLARAIYLSDSNHPSLPYFAHLMKVKTGAEIYYSSDIGPGFSVQHSFGIVVGPRHRIGRNFTIYQGTTLGHRRSNAAHEFITIGDGCVVFAGAKIFGTVTLGDNVRLAANAVLLTDAASNTTYAGIPAVKVGE